MHTQTTWFAQAVQKAPSNTRLLLTNGEVTQVGKISYGLIWDNKEYIILSLDGVSGYDWETPLGSTLTHWAYPPNLP